MLNKVSALLSGDIAFLASLLFIFFIFAMYLGRGRIISLILAFYPATLLYNAFPFINKLTLTGDRALVLGKIGVFLVFLIPINIIVGRYVFSESFYTGGDNILRNLGLSAAVVILIVLFSYNTVSFDVLHNFSPSMDAVFAGSGRVFWWNVAPVVLLGVL